MKVRRPVLNVDDAKSMGLNFQISRLDQMLRRVIYISRSSIGADPQEIEAVISSSIRWNTEAEVTGMLWADGESFA